ncbi:MAG: sigma-54-dependent Fis family transcriptional regulator [Planctomycetes bacterium]|nr:sigma-54-dependent Fis family transcriptional regulator [Planctomycetota bacterium]
MRWVIRRVFEDDEVDIAEAGNGREALALLETFAADVVLTDVAMPEMDGRELLRACRSLDQDLPVILVSALEDIDTAVGAMKEGAFDYLAKPFEIERLRATAQRAAEQHRLRREVADLRGRLLDDAVRFGSSPEAAELDRMLHLVAEQRELTVLLAGESGTGKEVAAREIHRRSPWRNGPFIAVDCGALPEHLIESQLFGHKKGAFTGADRDRPGQFRLADGGTLFLDEIGNLPLPLQAKLLRALQERAVVPVGGGDPEPFRARLVSATNVDLGEAIAQGTFRLDLFHRICEFTVRLPPLRGRPQDIIEFADRFLREANRDMGRRIEALSEAARTAITTYPWPGNLRELRNAIRRATVVCAGPELEASDLNLDAPERSAGADPGRTGESGLSLGERVRRATAELEAEILAQALEQAGGNKAAAARALQIDYTTLHRKLKRLGRAGD